MKMKSKHKKEQIQIANALFELGMDFNVIKDISGVDATDILLDKAGLLDYEDENNLDCQQKLKNNIFEKENSKSYQESRIKGTNKRDSNPDQ